MILARTSRLATVLWAAVFTLHTPSAWAIDPELRALLEGKTNHIERAVRRVGRKTLQVEAAISMPGELKAFAAIATDYPRWREWALTDINTPPPGEGDYLLQLDDLTERLPKQLTASFSIQLPFFGQPRVRTFRMHHENSAGSLTIRGTTILNESSVVKSAHATMQAFQSPNQSAAILWVQIRAVVEFKSRLLYEALPEKVLLREVGDRLQAIVENYQRHHGQIESKPQRKKGKTG